VLPSPLLEKWDTVLASEIIEHIPQERVEETLAVLERAARQRIILTTPNYPAFRPGHETIVGFNDHEAHLSYVSRRDLERRGYRIIGAGFGNPDSTAGRVFARLRLRPQFALESIPRVIPWLAQQIVAYKDV